MGGMWTYRTTTMGTMHEFHNSRICQFCGKDRNRIQCIVLKVGAVDERSSMSKIMRKSVSTLVAAGFVLGSMHLSGLGSGVLVEGTKAQESDCYATFWPNSARGVTMKICANTGGSRSGYTIIRNDTDRTMDVCWTIEFEDASDSQGCYSGLRPGQESRSSCYACNPSSGGPVSDVIWRRVDPR
jgi:hypothetical protein